ncbi:MULTISPECIES: divergent PAP2 family protein [Aerococcus]|uniref:Divergent PAP2 family protein n=2 Tax=Aerococcus TaxID=1375 RepID=A0A2I1L527_9LACT|nr:MULTISPECIES: divergent PAP2 family protein [Aerococcus]KAA9220222.1 divergent PAP2 family protein [Aerococcus loyolae]KAA9266254.1 divergent PAP2 family protein [Aerococcus loyolae]MCY3025250.1 divergent PAP2 family protein [Aerococcus loyolae]MCY3027069.1 divergent PAP2 family protein [Aerococcus loyolae]MCY3029341.1 divergent PAP2 family protein [Aerococcus loyolae]
MKNFPLTATIVAIIFTQIIKYPIAYLFMGKKETKLSIIHTTGGMPSSHTAAVTALITSLILQEGFLSPYVAIATAYGLIVMFDAMGVRRQSGEQGILIRELLAILREHHDSEEDGQINEKLDQIDDQNMVIDDYLGHKPSEVFGGFVAGVGVAFFIRFIFFYFDWMI